MLSSSSRRSEKQSTEVSCPSPCNTSAGGSNPNFSSTTPKAFRPFPKLCAEWSAPFVSQKNPAGDMRSGSAQGVRPANQLWHPHRAVMAVGIHSDGHLQQLPPELAVQWGNWPGMPGPGQVYWPCHSHSIARQIHSRCGLSRRRGALISAIAEH